MSKYSDVFFVFLTGPAFTFQRGDLVFTASKSPVLGLYTDLICCNAEK